MQSKVMTIVERMCSTSLTDCKGLNLCTEARKLMKLANVPSTAEIQEIPLCEDSQVVVLFLLPSDKNYYSLFAGIGLDRKFYFELSITGVLNGAEFLFFDEEDILPIDYFVRNQPLQFKVFRTVTSIFDGENNMELEDTCISVSDIINLVKSDDVLNYTVYSQVGDTLYYLLDGEIGVDENTTFDRLVRAVAYKIADFPAVFKGVTVIY